MELSQAPAARAVHCPQCQEILVGGDAQGNGSERCPKCRSELRVWRFPALLRSSEELFSTGAVALPGEAACFFHPEKKAVIGCERCGRFVCALCDLPVGNRHLCPSCVGGGLDSEKVPELVNRRFVWSSLALTIGWLPLLLGLIPFYVLSGPTAVFAGIWGWRKPGSLVQGRRRWAAVLGILGGLLQIAVVVLMVFGIWKSFERKRGKAHASASPNTQFVLTLQEENHRG